MTSDAIICPNCGASTTNKDYCEFCGSFLVGKVAQNIDISSYVAIKKEAEIDKNLKSVLEKLLHFSQEINSSLHGEVTLGILTIKAESLNVWVEGQKGGLILNCKPKDVSKFINSPLFGLFERDNTQNNKYSIYCGNDVEGLTILIQLYIAIMFPFISKTCYLIQLTNHDVSSLSKKYSIRIKDDEFGYLSDTYYLLYNSEGIFIPKSVDIKDFCYSQCSSSEIEVCSASQICAFLSNLWEKHKEECREIDERHAIYKYNEPIDHAKKLVASIGYPVGVIVGGIWSIVESTWSPFIWMNAIVTIAIIVLCCCKK